MSVRVGMEMSGVGGLDEGSSRRQGRTEGCGEQEWPRILKEDKRDMKSPLHRENKSVQAI